MCFLLGRFGAVWHVAKLWVGAWGIALGAWGGVLAKRLLILLLLPRFFSFFGGGGGSDVGWVVGTMTPCGAVVCRVGKEPNPVLCLVLRALSPRYLRHLTLNRRVDGLVKVGFATCYHVAVFPDAGA